jgi:long-chain acyl-CoA synthetase
MSRKVAVEPPFLQLDVGFARLRGMIECRRRYGGCQPDRRKSERTSAVNLQVNASRTLVELFSRRAAETPTTPAIHFSSDGKFVARTWRDIASDAAAWAGALREIGVERGDRVIQIAENRYEWIVTELAIHLLGAIHVAVHAALSGPQMAFQILDTEARVVLMSGGQVAQQLGQVQADWPRGVKHYSFDPCEGKIGSLRVESWSAAVASIGGSSFDSISANAIKDGGPNDLATILYSSGTTGEPKGVMLSHYNLLSNALACDALFQPEESELRVCWLPLSHIFARTCDLYCWIARGSELVLAESRDTVLANCQMFRPTIINGVPYFYDKVHRYCESQGGSDQEQTLRLQSLFGGRLQMACSGGAPLANGTAEYYHRHGIPLVQGYGLTESSPVISVSTPRNFKTGAVGQALQGVQIRIADDGEILTRGPHVMVGYWKNPQATAETINAEGWLRTGDLGRLDEDEFLWITGRKKELIVTAAGKNIAPAYLERLLTEDPLILQALVVGDRRNYLAALIVPNAEPLKNEIIQRRIAVRSADEVLVNADVLALYRERIDARLSGVSHCEQVGAFTLMNRGFTIEHDELTPTLKLRRSVIQQHFAREIEGMYAAESAARL